MWHPAPPTPSATPASSDVFSQKREDEEGNQVLPTFYLDVESYISTFANVIIIIAITTIIQGSWSALLQLKPGQQRLDHGGGRRAKDSRQVATGPVPLETCHIIQSLALSYKS